MNKYIVPLSCVFIMLTSCINNTANSCNIIDIESYFGQNTSISKPLSISEIEKKKMIDAGIKGEKNSLPFGSLNEKWKIMKSMYKEGDCIIFFTTSKKSWEGLYGREGYVIIRNKKIIYGFFTLIS